MQFDSITAASIFCGIRLCQLYREIVNGYLIRNKYFGFFDYSEAIKRKYSIREGWIYRSRRYNHQGSRKFHAGDKYGKLTIKSVMEELSGTFILAQCECGNYCKFPHRAFLHRSYTSPNMSCGCNNNIVGKYVIDSPTKNLDIKFTQYEIENSTH